MVQPKIALYGTNSAGCPIIYDLLKDKYSVNLIHKEDVENGSLRSYDLAIFPGGSNHLVDFIVSSKFREEIRRYVREGGKYLGTCGGTLLASWLFSIKMGFIRLFPYYIYYVLFNKRGKTRIQWCSGNIFNKEGSQEMTWVAGPYIIKVLSDTGHLKKGLLSCLVPEAYYAENKTFLPLKDNIAVASGQIEKGKLFLFCPHPEYSCGNLDNSSLILKAVEWFLG